MNFVIEGENLTKQYGQEVILNDVTVRVAPSEAIAIIGKSGGGKSTLLSIARAVLLDPAIILADEPTNDLHPFLSDQITDWLLEKKKMERP